MNDTQPDIVIKWIDEIVDVMVSSRKIEDSWVAQGGFRVTELGCRVAELAVKRKTDKTDADLASTLKHANETFRKKPWSDWGEWDSDITIGALIYIGLENICHREPTLADISDKLLNSDLRKTVLMMLGLLTFLLVEFKERQ